MIIILTLIFYSSLAFSKTINVCDENSLMLNSSNCPINYNGQPLQDQEKIVLFTQDNEIEKKINNDFWGAILRNKKTNYDSRIKQNLTLMLINNENDIDYNCNDIVAAEEYPCATPNFQRILTGMGSRKPNCSTASCISDFLNEQTGMKFKKEQNKKEGDKDLKSMESGECLTYEEKLFSESIFNDEEMEYFNNFSSLSYENAEIFAKDSAKRSLFKEKIKNNSLLGPSLTTLIDLLADDVPLSSSYDCPKDENNDVSSTCALVNKNNVKKAFEDAKQFITSYVLILNDIKLKKKNPKELIDFLKQNKDKVSKNAQTYVSYSCEIFSENLKNIACATDPTDSPSARDQLKKMYGCVDKKDTPECDYILNKNCYLKTEEERFSYFNTDRSYNTPNDNENFLNNLCKGFRDRKKEALDKFIQENKLKSCDKKCEEDFLENNFDKIKFATIQENSKDDKNNKIIGEIISSNAVKSLNKVDVEKESSQFKTRKIKSFNQPIKAADAPVKNNNVSTTNENKSSNQSEYTPITAPDMSKVNANYKYYQDYSERIKKLNEKANETTKKIEAIKDQNVKKYGPDEKSWPPQAQGENSELQKLRDEAAALRKEIDDLKKEAKKKFPTEAESKKDENKPVPSDSKNESVKTDTKSVTNNSSIPVSSGSTSSMAPSNVNQAAVADNTFVRPPIAVDNSPNSNTLESKLLNNVLLSIQEKKLNGTIVDRLKVVTLNAKDFEKINDKNIKDFVKPEGNQGTLEVVNKQDMNQKMLIRYWKNSDGIYQFEKLDQIKAKQVERKFRFDSMKDIIQKLTPVN